MLAPFGRDAAIMDALLRDAGIDVSLVPVEDAAMLARALGDGTGFAVATQEALVFSDLRPVADWVAAQPPWSDLPFIILTARGGGPERNPDAARLSKLLGNVVFLERPFHPTTFVSAARSALRGRSRQFEARDRIEALRRSEAALTRLNETLESRVAERTAALQSAHDGRMQELSQRLRAEEQLRHAMKLEAMGQITGGVAHDFNNLLLAVLANLDLLRDHLGGNPDGRALADGALQAAERGAALTQRLLAFARRQNLQVAPTDMATLVRGMMRLMERSLGPVCELHLELPDDLPPVLVDANQVELALLNLVVNARDAMPEGGCVTITLSRRDCAGAVDVPAGDYVCLCVRDTGCGMDEGTLKRAVEPFFSTKEPGKGTGLGLSMADGLMRQLNGRLLLSSRPGEGTHVRMLLPVAPATETAVAPAAAPAQPNGRAPLSVLLVEDDPLIAMATAAMLRKLGHRPTEARGGPQAIALLDSGADFDLMMTDYSMPKMNGMQLAEEARRRRPGLPILLATGYAELPAAPSLELPRIDKPYVIRDLERAIAAVMPAAPA